MKIRKIFAVIIAVCMLTFAQSAYAESIQPTAIGIGDTPATAIQITPNLGYLTLFLSNQADVDYFKWKNTSSSPIFINFSLQSPATAVYDFEFFIKYPTGTSSAPVQALDVGYGKLVSNIYLPPNCEIFFMVKATVFNSPTDLYQVAFSTRSIDF
ncbi:hypothetical protein A7K91_05095 [Paenibacillus oryzae]|uniref:NEAT domain-containing protein n=1 Tax=Paenibacillus oryzae TaxID=1844972 RepID=A0A1A5YH27_9BACL|nr:hypothetical protein [Paenibacillus oryzae]OBR64956.1 hypothetical protein A7K91_05095 [Paenibacillus oryzae]